KLSGIAAGRLPSSHVTFKCHLHCWHEGVYFQHRHGIRLRTHDCRGRTTPIAALPSRLPAQPQARMAAVAIAAYGHFPSGVVASTRFKTGGSVMMLGLSL